ncbi:helix-turn-helix domain-containing protein [Xanthobacter autotrophicus]|uniref:arsenate reductase/protein-tyrosine-phosphatase family protein n=1 Tax=Xanthobacter TaxID=279 RepID=UPI0024ABF016|nr:helix-turn-helix domain-containing protein [Xanthobacter autotrophicus]MDI4663440.1 helix-turn-helix domain-containing protein [Xanthobacter autotrophicus]
MDETRLNGEDAIRIFDALSQGTRFETYRLLLRYVPYGLPAGDIARLLAVPHNTMSTHLALLERANLVTARRDGRSIIYAASLVPAAPILGRLMGEMGFTLTARHGTLQSAFPQVRPAAANDRVYNVLLVCSGNSARSVIAEALLNREGRGRFRAYSAGSRPKSKPHPMALNLLASLGYDTAHLSSKSWDGFARPNAPEMDFVITTCDAAAGEICPAFPGHPLQAHWGLPDPLSVKGTEAEQKAALLSTYRRLAGRVSAFVNLPFEQLDLASLKERISKIGRMEGATDLTLSGQAA